MTTATIPDWVGEWVGVPFLSRGRGWQGVDCYGLVYRIYRERFGVELEPLDDRYQDEKDSVQVAAVARGAMEPWRPVPAGSEREGDVILLRVNGHPCHVGLVVAPGYMIHTERGKDSVLERYDGSTWSRRVCGVFRHVSRHD